jgi:hypothetical protein
VVDVHGHESVLHVLLQHLPRVRHPAPWESGSAMCRQCKVQGVGHNWSQDAEVLTRRQILACHFKVQPLMHNNLKFNRM